MQISENQTCQTVIVTYEVPQGNFDELHGILTGAYQEFISKQSGFISAAVHTNDAKTRVASYSQWQTRDDFLAVLRSDHMQSANQKMGELSKGFEPVLYEVQSVFN